MIISERIQEYHKKKYFWTSLKRDRSWRKILIEGNIFFCSNQWNGTIITEKSCSTQNEPWKTKLWLSGVLKHFYGGGKKIMWLSQKKNYVTISERS